MYSLRSRGATKGQATIAFPCRKRRQADEKVIAKENTSPEKKTKPDSCTTKSPVRRSVSSRTRRHLKLPLTEVPVLQAEEDHIQAETKVNPPHKLAASKLSKLQEAKAQLHSNYSSVLVGREEEKAKLMEFLQTHLKQRRPGSLYISGPPGTGKTATLTHLVESDIDVLKSTVIVTVNCMSVRQPQAIYDKIYSQLISDQPTKTMSNDALQKAIVKHITSTKKMILLVLDELDQLTGPCQNVLYSIFEWPVLLNSHLVLIGIANALDLTDRILPRLQAHAKICPQLLHYSPYTKDQLTSILTSRLNASATVVDHMAVQFCSRKVAALHGDARKALDICRAAIELVETSQKKEERSEPPRVTVSHVASVVAQVYGGGGHRFGSDEAVPLQQKLAVCSLLLLVAGRAGKEVTLAKIYKVYTEVCRKRQLKHESQSEFVGLLQMLETRGIVGIKKAKETMLTKVTLRQQEKELEYTLQDKVLLSSVLADGLPSIS